MASIANSYRNKKVLVTGHTGFKGSWLAIWLREMGADVIGLALPPSTPKDNYVLAELGKKITDIHGDIRNKELVFDVFERYKPAIVFHLAAQPLVRSSYEYPVETYEVNVMGTINILQAVRKTLETSICVCITTDKCYENKEQSKGYREDDKLGGYDPYSSSKGACEIAINSWRQSFFHPKNYQTHKKSIASARAGNVIGGGDWAQDRIIPDCIRSLEKNKPIEIRSPKAVRPWQHVLEPLSGYLLLAQKMMESPTIYAEAWNFGPEMESVISVWEIAGKIIQEYGRGELIDKSNPHDLHEARLLALNIDKAKFRLGWKTKLSMNEAIKNTVDWYKKYQTDNVYNLCVEQIESFLMK